MRRTPWVGEAGNRGGWVTGWFGDSGRIHAGDA